MMRNHFLKYSLLTIILCGSSAFAQDFDNLPKLKELKGKKLEEQIVPGKDSKTGLWGYVNGEGKFSIKPCFDNACPYEGKYARVSVDGKWGLLNEKGLFQIFPQYDSFDSFSTDSLARVTSDGKYGLINTYGNHIVSVLYDSIEYAKYGYLVQIDSKYGTMDPFGQYIIEPVFDEVSDLNRSKGLEHVFKDGKWGILRDGESEIDIEWDRKCVFLQSGKNGLPDLYTVVQGGCKGVVTEYGDYVVPVIYNDINMSLSGEYYVTSKDGKYGALSLNMDEIVPTILDSKPFFDENIFKVYDNGEFFCVNKQGSVTFESCDQMFFSFKPDEYFTSKFYPDWAKSYLIQKNVLFRQSRLEKAMKTVSDRARVSFQADDIEKYGLLSRGSFLKSSGQVHIESEEMVRSLNAMYEAKDGRGFSMCLTNSWRSGDFLLVCDGCFVSVSDIFAKFGIADVSGICPIDFCLHENDLVTVRFGILRSTSSTGSLKTYFPSSKDESDILMILSTENLMPVSCYEMDSYSGKRLVSSRFGGYYSMSSNSVIIDNQNPLKRFDKNGKFDWEYYPNPGEVFFDIEETENCLYLCGIDRFANKETTIMVQLSNRGERMLTKVLDFVPVKPDYIFANDYVIYIGKESDFWPVAAPSEINDEIGVRPASVWMEWGGGCIGGLGLIDESGNWLHTPVYSDDLACSSYNWDFGKYVDQSVIVQHHGKYGLIGKNGIISVDPKYEYIEQLDNPHYFKTVTSRGKGVVDLDGHVILPNIYSEIHSMCEDVIVARRNDGMYGCFDKTGKLIVPFEYEEIRSFVEGRARICQKGRFGFIDKSGELLVSPLYDEVENFVDNCSLVTVKGKKGIVNLDGDWVVPPMYDDGGSFSAGLAFIAQNDRFGYIDKSGRTVIPMQYSNAKSFNTKAGMAAVADDGLWGVIDKFGNTVVPLEYDKVAITDDGFIIVEKNRLSGVYSSSGKLFFPVECNRVFYSAGNLFRNGTFKARYENERVTIDQNGNPVYRYQSLTR